jgi:Ser/Thr protein kinase RdoA (MazF antagonist)
VAQPSARYAAFSPTELAVVCSNYDLGVIRAIKPVRVGSHGAPKVRIETFSGTYLLKRRESGHDDPFRVAASHAVQIHLASSGFPTPRIIGTRGENNSMLQLRGRIYELFAFVEGHRPSASATDPQSAHDTQIAGGALALFHDSARTLAPRWEAPTVAYHNAAGLDEQARAAMGRVSRETRPIIERLMGLFAAARAVTDGLSLPFAGLVHGDWHPGNLILADGRVLAVTDFDSVRVAPRVVDLANGLLQFSIEAGAGGGGGRPGAWGDAPSAVRFAAFLDGYGAGCQTALSEVERGAIGPLMVQALVAESLLPIARTGRFASLDPYAFLGAIERKAAWLSAHPCP